MPNFQTTTRASDTVEKKIGARIRILRIKRGMTQSGLAGTIGLSFQQVQKYENGTNRISIGTFLRICRVLEIDPGVILAEFIITGKDTLALDAATITTEGSMR
jgi:transcriptional regulator with XRE-family HTH domain